MEAAFFDLDKTVIARASLVAFGRPLYRNGLVSRRLLLRALWGQLVYLHLGADDEKIGQMRERVLSLTRGWDQARISAIVRDALEEVVEPIIFSEAADLIERHHAAGRRVVIVSASPEEIVAPLAQYLGADEAIASRAKVDDRGRYTGEMEFYAYGPAKADAMRSMARTLGIDLERSYAYSDSASDLPMLEAVGHATAVNPDRELLRAARERNWEVVTFARPVRLRDRVPVPPARPAALISGGVLAGAAAAGVWWWIRQRPPAPLPQAKPSGHRNWPVSVDQAARTFLAATTPRATRMARRSSFFMDRTLATAVGLGKSALRDGKGGDRPIVRR